MDRYSGKPCIFISYRHADSAANVGRLSEHLKQRFWPDVEVFRDLDSIKHGEDFDAAIGKGMEGMEALIVAIGPGWLDARDASGNRRLDNPGDAVRREIASAIRLGVTIIPVLLEDAKELNPDQLPDDIRPLASRKVLRLGQESWYFGINNLTKRLDAVLSDKIGIYYKATKYAPLILSFTSLCIWMVAPLARSTVTMKMAMPSRGSGGGAFDRLFESFQDRPTTSVVCGYECGSAGWLLLVLVVLYGISSIFFVTRPIRWFFSVSSLVFLGYFHFAVANADQNSQMYEAHVRPEWGLFLLTASISLAVFESLGGVKLLRKSARSSARGSGMSRGEDDQIRPEQWQ